MMGQRQKARQKRRGDLRFFYAPVELETRALRQLLGSGREQREKWWGGGFELEEALAHLTNAAAHRRFPTPVDG